MSEEKTTEIDVIDYLSIPDRARAIELQDRLAFKEKTGYGDDREAERIRKQLQSLYQKAQRERARTERLFYLLPAH